VLAFESKLTSKFIPLLNAIPSLEITADCEVLLNAVSNYCSTSSNDKLTLIIGIDEINTLKKMFKVNFTILFTYFKF